MGSEVKMSGLPLEEVSCNLCGSVEATELYPDTRPDLPQSEMIKHFRCTTPSYGIHYAIVKCSRCGLIYANPRPAAQEALHSYENVVDQTYLEEREGRVLTFRRNLEPLEEFIGPGNGRRLLDVGCHIGVFLEIAQERGWETWGVEPSTWASAEACQRGLRVREGTLKQAHFADNFFDVVTLWDVIEHLNDPLGELREVNRVLKPEGLICIHTINIESPLAHLMGARWPWLMEMHLYYFSPRTLRLMLEKANFSVVKWVNQGRYLRLGYLATRLQAYSSFLSHLLAYLVRNTGLAEVVVPVNLGDLFTVYARKALVQK
ncbi:MAG: class I SAM-dependent methyltransferase [Anaerolineae bacterium]